MRSLLLIALAIIFFTGCTEDPTKTEYKHTDITIQKDNMVVLDYDELVNEFHDKSLTHNAYQYDQNETYIIFRLSMDTYININKELELICGAKGDIKTYDSWGTADQNTSLEYGALAQFTKQDLDDHNCLQADGQLEDLTGSLYGYAEYTQNKVTPTKHTVTSNSITYTAQEINEAFALFNE